MSTQMSKFIAVVYTGTDTKAALIEAATSRVAIEGVCKLLGIRGVDVKYIFEDSTVVDYRAGPPVDDYGEMIALTMNTDQGWVYPEPQYKGDQVFLVTCFTRQKKPYIELFLVSAPNGYAALLDPFVWPTGMGVRAHQKRIDKTISGKQITEYDLTYKVHNPDGTDVDLQAAREEYKQHSDWWVHSALKGD